MTFIVCVRSDSEEKGEGTLCDAYLNRHTSSRPKNADNNDSVPIWASSKLTSIIICLLFAQMRLFNVSSKTGHV